MVQGIACTGLVPQPRSHSKVRLAKADAVRTATFPASGATIRRLGTIPLRPLTLAGVEQGGGVLHKVVRQLAHMCQACRESERAVSFPVKKLAVPVEGLPCSGQTALQYGCQCSSSGRALSLLRSCTVGHASSCCRKQATHLSLQASPPAERRRRTWPPASPCRAPPGDWEEMGENEEQEWEGGRQLVRAPPRGHRTHK